MRLCPSPNQTERGTIANTNTVEPSHDANAVHLARAGSGCTALAAALVHSSSPFERPGDCIKANVGTRSSS